jgi:hypothetical protein
MPVHKAKRLDIIKLVVTRKDYFAWHNSYERNSYQIKLLSRQQETHEICGGYLT